MDRILEKNKVDPYTVLADYVNKNEDEICCFFGFLVSKCVLRYAPGSISDSIKYKFSNPGRVIMEDRTRRTAFIEEFMKFYNNDSPS